MAMFRAWKHRGEHALAEGGRGAGTLGQEPGFPSALSLQQAIEVHGNETGERGDAGDALHGGEEDTL